MLWKVFVWEVGNSTFVTDNAEMIFITENKPSSHSSIRSWWSFLSGTEYAKHPLKGGQQPAGDGAK